ncbi:MAG: GTPase Era [Erysipelotrichaceae bacterium]|jgi:GTP-binding protein Era|nr:GTPase Era [Erysipelotrichaceae bacterium]MBR2826517.1 GTPase Era [Erysipelotrichaceae bacterium]MBR3351382.1 GTPase Era [Erysipelotrichaceae bacterium]
MSFKAGFVALIGKPNVGKSTLLNSVLSHKVAITTPKPQTTRDNIRGILTQEDCQIIFIDTPGIHKSRQKLSDAMVKRAYDAVGDVDVILLLVDPTKPWNRGDEIIVDNIRNVRKPKFLIVNKIDKLTKQELIEYLDKANQEIFDEIIPLSALRHNNIEELVETIKQYLPEDVQYYPGDMISDYPESFMMGEIIREKILLNTEEEVPHSIAVQIEEVTRKPNVVYIRAAIVCEKQSQKAIIIGKKGLMLKKIATFAREELEERLQSKVFLEMFVRVEENWRNRQFQLKELGYIDKE